MNIRVRRHLMQSAKRKKIVGSSIDCQKCFKERRMLQAFESFKAFEILNISGGKVLVY